MQKSFETNSKCTSDFTALDILSPETFSSWTKEKQRLSALPSIDHWSSSTVTYLIAETEIKRGTGVI